MEAIGISGKIAKGFLTSKLTPIIVAASLILGALAVSVIPREEEPQIVIPMVDVFVGFPGATPEEVEQRVTRPLERLLWEVKGVEYVYSIAQPGQNLTIVRFKVGEDMEKSLVNLYTKLMPNYGSIPAGITEPVIRPKSIDDVPTLALTLWSEVYSGYQLRRISEELRSDLKQDRDVSEIELIGGQQRQVRVTLEPGRLSAYNQSPMLILGALSQSNTILPSGSFQSGNVEYLVETGGFLTSAEDVGSVVVGQWAGRPVFLRDVADITDGPGEPTDYVFMGHGPASMEEDPVVRSGQFEAVTVAVSKKKGTNATLLSKRLLAKVEALKGTVLPSEVEVTVTRNYGETAKEKSDELLKHMLIATISVILLMALFLGWREAVVVAVAVPVTLALTMFVNYLLGYTLNRVTLFALIFSIGILVDDAIVVVENIHRHFKRYGPDKLRAIYAVDEVGNPTILATFAVIAALLPMAFVSGLMGPYMRPIPVGASVAMIFSLLVAFTVSPWLSFKVLGKSKHSEAKTDESSRMDRLYETLLRPLVKSRSLRLSALAVVGVLLLMAMALVPLKKVTMKMLPFDNKSELQVIIDMPEGTTLEQTAAVTREMSEFLKTVPQVRHYQSYVGAASPYNFNGLVRHYYLRGEANLADIQVNFVEKNERSAQSHDLAKQLRPRLTEIAEQNGAKVKVAEIPPGPPVLSTLVAEIYGPDSQRQIEIARDIRKIFEETPGVVDVDWYVEDQQPRLVFEVDKEKAALSGVATGDVARTLRMALAGMNAGILHLPEEKEPVEINLRMSVEDRSDANILKTLKVPSRNGSLVPIGELVKVTSTVQNRAIYHKNLKRVTYVIGDVAGTQESPVYAILNMKDRVAQLALPEEYELEQHFSEQPPLEDRYTMKWDGEWQITYEVFRDLGIAFGAVLILIYILVVAWFRSFSIPLVIMLPIPLTLVGILPAHWLMGTFFTATSMIGFIALAGIVVRNSILLVDFIQMEEKSTGGLIEAVIKAGTVRSRPIILTAAAVMVGSVVMYFDPIFQGLAIAMMSGAMASTFLTLLAVPLAYYELFKGSENNGDGNEDEDTGPDGPQCASAP
ncbi:MAG: efflux RND transporter permease subunit [bacterium]|nr:efflux RND transporter permease subunit [bacterium]MDT8366824.1 efflux RND transporter permease subunit [bacterium]